MIDNIIIGSGPAGLFAAYYLIKHKQRDILIIDKNKFPSGGLLNDCKLNLTPHIGMDLEQLFLNMEQADALIKTVDRVFINMGAPKELYGTKEKLYKQWQERAYMNNGILIPAKQRHIGTDNSKEIIQKFRAYLESRGCKFVLGEKITDINVEDNSFVVHSKNNKYKCKKIFISPGREGSKWLRNVAKKIGIEYSNGKRIDVGIRLELARENYPITDVLYDPKFKFNSKYNTIVRTFCTNPGGRVRIERYDEFSLINGDALKRKKTLNTNFALLNTIELTEPLTDPFVFGRLIASATNIIGNGKPIIQRMGDFLDEKRSKIETFYDSSRWFDKLKPTLLPPQNVIPGDIRIVYPYKIIKSLKQAMILLNKIFDNTILKEENLIYAPEIKFYSLNYKTDKYMQTNIKNLYVGGDGAGKSRGIVGAAISGILAAKGMLNE